MRIDEPAPEAGYDRQTARGTPRPGGSLRAHAVQLVLIVSLAALVAAARPPQSPRTHRSSLRALPTATSATGQQVQAAYGCFPGTLDWPVVTCAGNLPIGDYLDTNTVGIHTFTVHAVDYAGAETTVTHTYTVFDVIPPTATIATPGAGVDYPLGAQLYATTPATTVPAVRGHRCIGTYPNGYPLPTDRPGTFTFTSTFRRCGESRHGHGNVPRRRQDAPEVTIWLLRKAPSTSPASRSGRRILSRRCRRLRAQLYGDTGRHDVGDAHLPRRFRRLLRQRSLREHELLGPVRVRWLYSRS